MKDEYPIPHFNAVRAKFGFYKMVNNQLVKFSPNDAELSKMREGFSTKEHLDCADKEVIKVWGLDSEQGKLANERIRLREINETQS